MMIETIIHEHEMSSLHGQAPLAWEDCINADDHRDLAALLDRMMQTADGTVVERLDCELAKHGATPCRVAIASDSRAAKY
jgi:hypothetical protein